MRNAYKQACRKAARFGRELYRGEWEPGSLQDVMTKIKGPLDNAFAKVDKACVQGVINRIEAAENKDRVCRIILEGCQRRGYIKNRDPYTPAFQKLGYEVPECNFVREPRPWQLPGWKSPWMLKKEYDRWLRKKRKEAGEI